MTMPKNPKKREECIRKIKEARAKQVFSKEIIQKRNESIRNFWKSDRAKKEIKKRSKRTRENNIKNWNNPKSGFNNPQRSIRISQKKETIGLFKAKQKMVDSYGYVCFWCGFKGNSFTINVHHINGNRKDNRPENLMLLCRKCHLVEAHYTNRYRERDEKGRYK